MESAEPIKRRSRLGRGVRLTVGVAGLLSLVAFVALWVLSYRGFASLQGELGSGYYLIGRSYEGRLVLRIRDWSKMQNLSEVKRGWNTALVDLPKSLADEVLKQSAFRLESELPKSVSIAAPHWFLVVLSGVVITLAGRRAFRFTIRTLLVVLTVAALIMGTIVALSR